MVDPLLFYDSLNARVSPGMKSKFIFEKYPLLIDAFVFKSKELK